jgi:DNA polymerase-1
MNFLDMLKLLFDNVWVIDTEYRQPDGHPKEPRCFCAVELFSGKIVRKWYFPGQSCPIQFGKRDIIITYTAGAESGYFHRAGWPTRGLLILDTRLLQLWIMNGDRRWDEMMDTVARETGEKKRKRNLQLAAKMAGLPLIAEKAVMRDLIMSPQKTEDFSLADQGQILEYCLHDVYTTAGVAKALWEIAKLERDKLYGTPLKDQDFLLMLVWWSKYAWAMGVAQEHGIRADYGLLEAIQHNAPVITQYLLGKVVRVIKDYDKTPRLTLGNYLAQKGIPWPRTEKGNLSMKQEIFRDMQGIDPVFGDLYQLVKWKVTVQSLLKIEKSPDGRLHERMRIIS